MVVFIGFTVAEPDFLLPVEKFLPVQDVVLVELQESDALPPEETTPGVAVRDAVGDAAAVAPPPEQSPVL